MVRWPSEAVGTGTMALRGRRHWLAIDGLGGPSYKTSDFNRLRYAGNRTWLRPRVETRNGASLSEKEFVMATSTEFLTYVNRALNFLKRAPMIRLTRRTLPSRTPPSWK